VRPERVAYALLACLVVAERLLRQGRDAARFAAGAADCGTTHAVGRAFGLSLLALGAAPPLNRWGISRLPWTTLAWGGVVVMGAVLALRVWAARTLGASYTRTLRVGARQRLVADGPYRLVRHPGYLGTLLLWLGAALASENGLAAVTIAMTMGRAYQARLAAEEAMLSEAFADEYRSYAAHTWRLIPLVY